MMLSIVGTNTDYKIVHLLLIVDRHVRHVSSTSSAMVFPAIEQEWPTFRTIVVYGYEQKEEAIFNGNTWKYAFDVNFCEENSSRI